MRRSIKILPAYLILSAIPYMLGAVMLYDADVQTADPAESGKSTLSKSADKMPGPHGPILESPAGPVLVDPHPAILAQPIKASDEKDKKAAKKKPAVAKAKVDKTKETDQKKSPKKKAERKTVEKPAPVPPVEPLEPLGPEMEALRDQVRKTLDYYSSRPLNTRDNTAAHILQACLAFGCDTTVRQGGSSGEPVNGLTCLCWNYPCGGYNLLRMSDNHVAARIGYGLQSNPSQFLAVLALARVPIDYPIRVDDTVRSVADLVESEKRSCRAGSDLSFKLIGLSRYIKANATWKNDLGQTWSVARLVKEELDHAHQPAPCGGTYRLLALGYAVDRRDKRGQPIDGQFRRAKKYIDNFQDYALTLQNPDGSWHPEFLKSKGKGGSAIEQVNSTGHILAWLAVTLPAEKLDDARVVRSVGFLSNLLIGRRYNSLTKTSSLDITARMHALYALSVYNSRVFKPHDKAEEPVKAEEPAGEAKVAKRASAQR